jgi:hypothetical protein
MGVNGMRPRASGVPLAREYMALTILMIDSQLHMSHKMHSRHGGKICGVSRDQESFPGDRPSRQELSTTTVSLRPEDLYNCEVRPYTLAIHYSSNGIVLISSHESP